MRGSCNTGGIMLRLKCSISISLLLLNWLTFYVCKATLIDRCDLVHKFKSFRPAITYAELNTWTCIAAHQSQFNVSKANSDTATDIQYHGIFQISDAFWCSRTAKEKRLCQLMCDRLHDADISDDIECVQLIYAEHLRIHGNGFRAWPTYEQCINAPDMVSDCLNEIAASNLDEKSALKIGETAAYRSNVGNKKITSNERIYSECELAHELRYSHNIAIEQVPIWVCIANFLTKLNTSFVATDSKGFSSYGLFQINDIYWCSNKGASKGCNINCSNLKDSHISDDVECVRRIYDEHERLSGNGFNAWAAYEAKCKHESDPIARECFGNDVNNEVDTKPINRFQRTGKVYERCELARELRYRHNIPLEQIPTWTCIAQYQSNMVTSMVRATDHGIFQINERYWCGIGKACGVKCAALEDTDIADDVKCAAQIYSQHERLYGDGFTAWSSYELYCKHQTHFTSDCFDTLENTIDAIDDNTIAPHRSASKENGKGKIYNRCELAKKLFDLGLAKKQIGTWVCIAKHESNFDTSAVGHLNADGSGDHGIFQISDLYWCSITNRNDKACGVPCSKFEDADIADDVACVKKIHDEHQRLFGSGFHAWSVYEPHCKHATFHYVSDCFASSDISSALFNLSATTTTATTTATTTTTTTTEKAVVNANQIIDSDRAYERCELAKELRYMHNVPLQDISKWVCIALYQSNLATSAKGVREYGLFQISSEFWCTNDGSNGKACKIECTKFLDSDITDDIACARTIFNEHSRFGSGFNAWVVYEPFCLGRSDEIIAGCFDDFANMDEPINAISGPDDAFNTNSIISYGHPRKPTKHGKVYDRCELAKELRYLYNMNHVHTWICIAQRESNFDTSAVGRLNADGSGDHGLFQISDLYWCSALQPDGKACGVPCTKFEDSDIHDDVKCVKKIYAEHQQLFGNGFHAWTTYEPYCKSITSAYVDDCFADELNINFTMIGDDHGKLPQKAMTFTEDLEKDSKKKIEYAKDDDDIPKEFGIVEPKESTKDSTRLGSKSSTKKPTIEQKMPKKDTLVSNEGPTKFERLPQMMMHSSTLGNVPVLPPQPLIQLLGIEQHTMKMIMPRTTLGPFSAASTSVTHKLEIASTKPYKTTRPMKATILSPTMRPSFLATDASSFVSVTTRPTIAPTKSVQVTSAAPPLKTTAFNLFAMYLSNYKTKPPKRYEFPELFPSKIQWDSSPSSTTTTTSKPLHLAHLNNKFLSNQFSKLAPFVVPNSTVFLLNQSKTSLGWSSKSHR